MKKILLLLSVFLTLAGESYGQAKFFAVRKAEARFSSEAPLELIKAKSNSIRGLINPVTKEFAFTMKVNSFEGFNSEIQRVHFLENYMDQTKYPQASFSGKLIEDISFDTPGTYSVRAKGFLEIHGVQKERIIRGTITIKPGSVLIDTDFSVPLSDHGISIPKVVKQKISDQINVSVDIEFVMTSKS